MSGRDIALVNSRIPRLVVKLIVGVLIGLVAFECSIGLVMVDPGRIGWLMGPAAGSGPTTFLAGTCSGESRGAFRSGAHRHSFIPSVRQSA